LARLKHGIVIVANYPRLTLIANVWCLWSSSFQLLKLTLMAVKRQSYRAHFVSKDTGSATPILNRVLMLLANALTLRGKSQPFYVVCSTKPAPVVW